MVISPQRHLIWSQEISGTTFSKKKKKLYKEYFYIEKIHIPLRISCFFCTLFKT